MHEIIALVHLIHHSKFRADSLLNIILEPNTQMRRLYDAIAEGHVQSEEDLRVVMPELAQHPAKLHTLKSRLKDRLLNSVLFLDLDESAFSDRQAAFGQCVRKWSVSIVLFSKNSWQIAVPVLENLLRHTNRFEFTEITINILRTLRLYYGTMIGNQARYEEVDGTLKRMELTWMAECKAETLYTDLIMRYVCRKAGKLAIATKAEELYAEIKPEMEAFPTYRMHFFGRLIETMIYDSRHDFVTMAAACEDAIQFFESKDYHSGSALQGFYYNLFLCLMNLRQYDRCRELANKYEALYEIDTYNWFKLQELYFLVAMQSGQYEEAAEICTKTMLRPGMAEQPAPVTELWKIFEAYIHFLGYIGALTSGNSADRFKIARFLNEVQVFSKDKRGMNIPILIVQFLFTLAEGQFEELSDRVENLTKYRVRYLDEHALRSNYFFRMMEQLPKSGFSVPDVKKRAAKYLDKLHEVPLEMANQNHEVEIIPYEILWDLLLEILAFRGSPGAKKAALADSRSRQSQ